MDVGINVVDGRLVGDVDFESARRVASALTPVPGAWARSPTRCSRTSDAGGVGAGRDRERDGDLPRSRVNEETYA